MLIFQGVSHSSAPFQNTPFFIGIQWIIYGRMVKKGYPLQWIGASNSFFVGSDTKMKPSFWKEIEWFGSRFEVYRDFTTCNILQLGNLQTWCLKKMLPISHWTYPNCPNLFLPQVKALYLSRTFQCSKWLKPISLPQCTWMLDMSTLGAKGCWIAIGGWWLNNIYK